MILFSQKQMHLDSCKRGQLAKPPRGRYSYIHGDWRLIRVFPKLALFVYLGTSRWDKGPYMVIHGGGTCRLETKK